MPPEIYIKYAPTILAVCREVLSQLEFIKREQEKIIVNQKNVIYSPLQIVQEFNRLEEAKKKEKEGN